MTTIGGTSMMRRAAATRTAAAAGAICAAMVLSLLAGCAQSAAPASSSHSSTDAADLQQYTLSISRCMRDKGFDVPDPDSDGALAIPTTGDPEAIEKAYKECESSAGPLPGAEDVSEEEMQQFYVQVTECLRQEGYDVADPAPGESLRLDETIPEEALSTCAEKVGSGSPSAPQTTRGGK